MTAGRCSSARNSRPSRLDPGLARRVDRVALHHYLTYQYVPAPWSIYEGVSKLLPGHILTWQDGKIETRRYWDAVQYPI